MYVCMYVCIYFQNLCVCMYFMYLCARHYHSICMSVTVYCLFVCMYMYVCIFFKNLYVCTVCTVCTCHYHSTICMSVKGFLTLTAINDLGGVQSDMTDDQTAAAEKKGRRPIFISYTHYFIDFIFYSVFILLF